MRRELVERPVIGVRAVAQLLDVRQARLQCRRDERLEVAPAELGIRVLARDDLALLGEPQSRVRAASRLREDRVVRGAAPAADGAAAAVEEHERDAGVAERRDEVPLGPVERPVRREVAAVLVAVRVAQHHLLPVAASGDEPPPRGQRERLAHDPAGALEVVDRLEQRHDVERGTAVAHEPGRLEQHRDLEQVRDRLALGDHVVGDGLGAVVGMDARGRVDDRELGARALRIVERTGCAADAGSRARRRAARRAQARPAPHSPRRPRSSRASRRRPPRARRRSGAGRATRGGNRTRPPRSAAARAAPRRARPRRASRANRRSSRGRRRMPRASRRAASRRAARAGASRPTSAARSPRVARRRRSAPAGTVRPGGAGSRRARTPPGRAAPASAAPAGTTATARRPAGGPRRDSDRRRPRPARAPRGRASAR